AILVREHMQADPFSGAVYVFRAKRADRIKLIFWDGTGLCLFAYGLADWWEVGLYLPFAIQDRQFLSDSVKLRTLFVSPHADQRDFFYGVNFELSNTTPKFAQTRFGLEIRPIVGVRNADWEFIVNPIVDIGFGKYGQADFAPAVRLARKLDKDYCLSVWNTTPILARSVVLARYLISNIRIRGNRFQARRVRYQSRRWIWIDPIF
ncbi:IS66 family insertion sequence element accessory protein TnpB, partial [Bradyrhizobium betae]|uniref:IS66 family insertion sequence element accessory protein TnpB n=1 Tax=Bradyrhizobium betae TaxID=244734 RepID=UPI0019D6CD6F